MRALASRAAFLWGRRGERGLPAIGGRLPTLALAFVARRRRAKGYYDGRTLALFRCVWLRTCSVSALLDYVLFRRDLGFPLADRWVVALSTGLKHLSARRQRLASALLAEVGASAGSDWVKLLAANRTALHEQQEAWREAFAQWILQQAEVGICVVGNAGAMRGSGLGQVIDQHGLVVRFNRFRGAESDVADIGERLDVWVVAPGYTGAPPPAVRWIVVSGPDMRFRRQNWDSLGPALDAGVAVLTTPLPLWRELVAQLQAPPSAGLLFLAWLRALLGSWDGVIAVGFGVSASSNAPYHHAVRRHRAVARHNWPEERALLQHWHSEGLESYGSV